MISKGEVTRRRILQTAAESLSGSGAEALRLRQLAQAAGLTEPALYRHFTDKTQLYRKLLQLAADELEASLPEQPASMSSLADALLDHVLERPARAAVLQHLMADTTSGAGPSLFSIWRQRCQLLDVDADTDLLLLNLLNMAIGVVRHQQAQGQDFQTIEPRQRKLLRAVALGWMLT